MERIPRKSHIQKYVSIEGMILLEESLKREL